MNEGENSESRETNPQQVTAEVKEGEGDKGNEGAEGGEEAEGAEGNEGMSTFSFDYLPEGASMVGVRIGEADYRLGAPLPANVANSMFRKEIVSRVPKTDDSGNPLLDENGKMVMDEKRTMEDIFGLPFIVFCIRRYGPEDPNSSDGFFRIVSVPKKGSMYHSKRETIDGKEQITPGKYCIIDEPVSVNSRVQRMVYYVSEFGFEDLMLRMDPFWIATQFSWPLDIFLDAIKVHEITISKEEMARIKPVLEKNETSTSKSTSSAN